jgi:hypothetical protein
MGFPFRSPLYRRAGRAVIWLVAALSLFSAQTAGAQIARKAKTSKGPRALGLLELAPNGQAHLIPIAIMVEEKFYDAQAYKASPVPMALWSEVVYEAEKSGVSQGLFTVTGALQNQKTGEWMAEGKWQTASALAAAAHAKATFAAKPRGMDQDEGPPVLRHSGANKPAPPESGTAQPSAPPATETAKSSAPAPAQPASAPAASSAPASPPETATGVPQASPEPEDPNRPILKRGKQPPRPEVPESASTTTPPASKPAPAAQKKDVASNVSTVGKASEVQFIPAISDASGPEPQSYVFVLKAGEEEEFRKKMLALAADEIRARNKEASSEAIGAAPHPAQRGKTAPVKPSQPNFKDVELRLFDLANSNEATLVLTAKAECPASKTVAPREYLVTLVAREDLNGDFHKVFSAVTDAQHLDVEPRWQLIDAVDANGDGAGELLFRKIFDTGSTYAIYRVIGDQLYPLFEGTPGE